MNILGILAGKGGVGKSTVTAFLARSLAEQGLKVGILDADLYGPSIPKMLPIDHLVYENQNKIFPAKSEEIKIISLGILPLGLGPAMIRAPIANDLMIEFLNQVEWGDIDYLLIDFPPGTGDIQLTLMQQASLIGTIVVTAPQEVALLDVKKALEMSLAMCIPILGIIENYSFFLDNGGQKNFPFGKEGGRKLANEYNLPLLAEIPIDSEISFCCDKGTPLKPRSPLALCFYQLASKIRDLLPQSHDQRGSFEIIWDQTL